MSGSKLERDKQALLAFVAIGLVAGLLTALIFSGLGRPLFWNDEADTAVLGERVLRHGRPVVTGEPSLAYYVRPEHIRSDGAYTAGVWGQYYLAAAGIWASPDAPDPHSKTAYVRFAFASTGFTALGLLAIGLAPLAGNRRRRRVFVLAFVVILCVSTSLLLHLREARYYAPAVLFTSLAALLYAHAQLTRRIGPRVWLIAGTLSLIALFNFFPPAFGTLGLAMGLAITVRSLRSDAPNRLRSWLWAVSPLILAAAMAASIILAFGLLEQAEFVATTSTRRDFATNLAFIVNGLLRFEFLGPAILAHAGCAWVMRADANGASTTAPAQSWTAFVLLFAVVHSASIAMLPLAWERYLIVLSPLLSAALVLDALALSAFWNARDLQKRNRSRLACSLVIVSTILSVGLRAPEIEGYALERRRPTIGPIDAIVPYLRENFDDPGALVIATNYEGPAYTYYLGSHVIVGYYGQNLAADVGMLPDVIIPRPWPTQKAALLELYGKSTYREVTLPARQHRTNNVPMLWPNSPGRLTHRFETQAPRSPREAVVIFVRDP